jgi:tRNA modification GTPase
MQIAAAVWAGRPPGSLPPRTLSVGRVLGADGRPVDQCLIACFPRPASYTGEDMVEVHCHGGVLAARAVLLRLLEAGARHAEPGEFSKRAFLNGKMDLTQAEAVADLIEAHTDMALHLANRQLDGMLGRQLHALYDGLLHVLSEVESRLDFPEEDLDWVPVPELTRTLADRLAQVDRLLARRREGEVLRHGVRLVIAGPPNVGKSSLLNLILGRDRAIVTHIPGTTRDTLEELAHIRGIPVRLTDTAGIRESEDLVERSGVERSLSSIRAAQVVLWLFDVSQPTPENHPPPHLNHPTVLLVGNKVDKLPQPPPVRTHGAGPITISALTGAGLEELFDAIEKAVWGRPHGEEPEVAVSVRHAVLLDQAGAQLADALDHIRTEEWEVAAATLRSALDAVGRVTGKTASDDLLDTVFSRFCIGK